jgi:hypothetical protein
MSKAQPITVFLPDTRGVEISRYGIGNAKIGFPVFTYSRVAGNRAFGGNGTCPGATDECERVCYAKRISGPVRHLYQHNLSDEVPPIPEACKLLRIHVSGDFDTWTYILNWYHRLKERPDVLAWAYTRSWRVPELLPHLENLRKLPNMQLFASMDWSHSDQPPAGWRRAWIADPREHRMSVERHAHLDPNTGQPFETFHMGEIFATCADGERSYVCPEETGRKANCVECGYCFKGRKHDVTFLLHEGDAK